MIDFRKERFERTGEMDAIYFLENAIEQIKKQRSEGRTCEMVVLTALYNDEDDDEIIQFGHTSGSILKKIAITEYTKTALVEIYDEARNI